MQKLSPLQLKLSLSLLFQKMSRFHCIFRLKNDKRCDNPDSNWFSFKWRDERFPSHQYNDFFSDYADTTHLVWRWLCSFNKTSRLDRYCCGMSVVLGCYFWTLPTRSGRQRKVLGKGHAIWTPKEMFTEVSDCICSAICCSVPSSLPPVRVIRCYFQILSSQ